ncbi:hypothetical protein PHYC_02256 [Phycisphaerales bacterium]|nr:hypothetical protein PHYC_02256 [Phycisphaerales bacterium]
MDIDKIEKQFERIGARVKFRQFLEPESRAVRLDVRTDDKGEFFDLRVGAKSDLRVIDARDDIRHLLLLRPVIGAERRARFLCGHDERHWFVASVPDRHGVSNVYTAMEALKPEAVRLEQVRRGVTRWDRLSRRTAAYIRQGEWFFVPRSDAVVDSTQIRRNEPIRRGGGKAHYIDEVSRTGGETVYVNRANPNGLTQSQFADLIRRNPGTRRDNWQRMRRDARVLARGRVRHPDHETIVLPFWHEVFMNTENEAPGARFVAFLD